MCLYLDISIHLSISLFIYISTYIYIHIPNYKCVYQSIYLSITLSVSLVYIGLSIWYLYLVGATGAGVPRHGIMTYGALFLLVALGLR